jgi:hypothetical protein
MMRRKGGLLRHLEGWEAGLLAVVIALFGTLLAVPMKVAPNDVPLPLANGKLLAATLEREHALASSVVPMLAREIADPAQGTEFYDLRALGEQFRAYGRAEMSEDVYAAVRARQKLAETVGRARALGDDKLLGLRAYQRRLFLTELERWERSGAESDELTGLGGRFVALATRDGWLDGRTIAMNDSLRGIFFKRRWNEIAGLTQAPFALSLDEQRAFYAFLLEHPHVEGNQNMTAEDACRAADRWRLRKIEEIAAVDPSYPYALARGVLLYRVGRFPAAAQALRDYLAAATDGRYALRARNYLVAAMERENE